MEKVISRQLIKYLSENNLIHAYRAKHNTGTAMIEMVDSWVGALESGEMAGVCLLDMSSAFDIVSHDILLRKLKLYGFQQEVILWFNSHLTNRRQCVSINGCLSK